MQLFYNGKDITSSVQATSVQVTDNATGKPDSLFISFADPDGIWSQWEPTKNDTLRVRDSGFDTGECFIDQITLEAGTIAITALSIPQVSKSTRSQGWENVRFMEFVTQIAARYGFTVQTYGVVNHLYDRVDQNDEADFAFLAYRCLLEGYGLKINNRSVVIYNESAEEQKVVDPNLGFIRESDINGRFRFVDKSVDIYEKCVIRSTSSGGFIEAEFKDNAVNGPTLKKNLYVSNQAEANRWAKGLLRACNKHRITGKLPVNLNTNYAAGTCVEVEGVGMFSGKYFVDKLTHDLIKNQTILLLRKPLEGY